MNRIFLILIMFLTLHVSGQVVNPFTQRYSKSVGPVDAPPSKQVIRYSGSSTNAIMSQFPDEIGQALIITRDPENRQVIRIHGFDRKKSYSHIQDILENLELWIGKTPQIGSPKMEIISIPHEKGPISESNWTVKGKQFIKNIPVYGGEFVLSGLGGVNGQLIPQEVLGRLISIPENAPETPQLDKSKATVIAQNRASVLAGGWNVLQGFSLELVGGNQCQIELMYYQFEEKLHLAYICTVRPNTHDVYKVIIDAQNGQVLEDWQSACHANGPTTTSGNDLNGVNRTINNYEYNSRFYLLNASETMFNSSSSNMPDNPVGAIWTLDAQNTDGANVVQISRTSNSGWSATSISAHYNAKLCYDYYKTKHSRNGINGSGGNIISVINVTSNGQGMDNAYWNGKAMWYGNGKNSFKPLAGSVDVAGHEMTHGVVENTANLEYKNQSGALNESFADVFGAMIENKNWQIGEEVVKTAYYPSGALRDMADPHNGGSSLSDPGYQPKLMREIYKGTQDNGGVHINSGIPNHAYYLIATAITKAKAEKIYYRALSLYLTATSKFLDLRFAVVKAATDLYGNGTEVSEVKKAFDYVEIFDPGGSSTTPTAGDLSVNPGQDYIISYDINYSGLNTRWFRSTTAGSSFLALSTTKSKAPMSLPDNGAKGYYVSRNAYMYSVTLSGTPTENLAQSQSIWDNVAISKDGSKIASITTSVDSSIYMYDGSNWNRFQLYNPTSANGVNSGGVLFAGALEWNYTGEYVMYDALNVIRNGNGNNIYYWDVGMIRVWDNRSNSLGDGKVTKLFSNLPSGVNIGNPSFSKNSPHIIAFDYISTNTTPSTYATLVANLANNTTKTVFTNSMLSFPNYSKNDDKLIFTSEDFSGDTHIYVMPIKSDKMTSNGTESKLIPDAKWGTWYSTGTRKLLNADKVILTFAFPGLTPIVQCTISGTNITGTLPAGADASNLIPTFTYSPLAMVSVSGVEQVSGASTQDFTNPVDYVVRAQDGSTQTYRVTLTLPKSNAKEITSYVFGQLTPQVVCNINGNQITGMVPTGTDLTNLVANFTISPKATLRKGSITQVSGSTVNNYTFPITLTITAEDGTMADYTVTVAKGSAGTGKDLLSFGFANPSVSANINGISVVAQVPPSTNLNALVAVFTVSSGATVYVGSTLQTSGQNVNDFSIPLTYTVKAADNSTRDYVVSVVKTTGIENTFKSGLRIWPNPTKDILNVEGTEFRYELFQTNGIKMMESGLIQGLQQIPMQGVPSGIYFLRITNAEGVKTYKILHLP